MKDPRSLPKGHSFIMTEDGSYTLFSDLFQEACHSTSGAKAETCLHYIEGCQVLNKLETRSSISILEIGFGLGVGFLTTLEMIPSEKKLTFVSMELDRNLLEWFAKEHHEIPFEWSGNLLKAKKNNFELIIIQGDARIEFPKYLKEHSPKFEAIYQDAFSPKKNPSLWTKEWFELLKSCSREDAILSTYSASTSIRKSLHETGWGVQKGEKFGPKRTSTRAVLNKSTDPEILLQMERSPVLALTDLQIDPITKKIIS
jgi:tRNA U34 5-methylaminomethyl-2-thiouridine-forming methyltransferase MnmC